MNLTSINSTIPDDKPLLRAENDIFQDTTISDFVHLKITNYQLILRIRKGVGMYEYRVLYRTLFPRKGQREEASLMTY